MEEAGDEPLFCERAAGIDIGKQLVSVTIRVPSDTRRGGRAAGDAGVRHHPPPAAGDGGLAALLAGAAGRDGGHQRLLEAGVFPAGAGGPGLPALPGVAGQGAARAAEDRPAGLRMAGQDHRAGLAGGQLRAAGGHPPARTHTRYRRRLIQARTAEKARCEKLLEDAHLKLSSVISDIHGVSGRDMLRAIIAGERNPEALAQMARTRMRRKIAQLREALDCSFFTPDHAFVLQMMLGNIDHYTAQIGVLDERIAVLCEPYERQVAQLDGIPGFGVRTAQDLIGEIGVDMGVFPTAGHLCSWARLAPRVRESAGRRKGKNATGRGNPYIGGTLGEAAAGAGRTQTFLGAKYRRLCIRMPKKKAQGAIMRDQLVITHALLSDPGAGYRDLGTGYYEQRERTRRRVSSHVRSLERLGYKVTIEPLTPEADPETGELITRTAS